jgi:hypothetical protein
VVYFLCQSRRTQGRVTEERDPSLRTEGRAAAGNAVPGVLAPHHEHHRLGQRSAEPSISERGTLGEKSSALQSWY